MFPLPQGRTYTFFDSSGEVKLPNPARRPRNRLAVPSVDSHVVTRADGKSVSSALIDHPGNSPSAWHGARAVSFLNPCVTAKGPVKIAAKQPLTLRYRAVTYDGKFPDGMLDRMADRWRKTEPAA